MKTEPEAWAQQEIDRLRSALTEAQAQRDKTIQDWYDSKASFDESFRQQIKRAEAAEARVKKLEDDLDLATHNRWRQEELDAAKYRASVLACELGWCDHSRQLEALCRVIKKSEPLNPDFSAVVDKHFWDLI